MTWKALKVPRDGIEIQPNRIVCLSPDILRDTRRVSKAFAKFFVPTFRRFIRCVLRFDGIAFSSAMALHIDGIDCNIEYDENDTDGCRVCFSSYFDGRTSATIFTRSYIRRLSFASRFWVAREHRSISSSIFALSVFKLYYGRYFEDTIPLYVSVLRVSYRNALKTWKIQDSIFTNRFATSAWSKRLEVRFRGISRSSTLIRSAWRAAS